jgi:hypothetical protein
MFRCFTLTACSALIELQDVTKTATNLWSFFQEMFPFNHGCYLFCRKKRCAFYFATSGFGFEVCIYIYSIWKSGWSISSSCRSATTQTIPRCLKWTEVSGHLKMPARTMKNLLKTNLNPEKLVWWCSCWTCAFQSGPKMGICPNWWQVEEGKHWQTMKFVWMRIISRRDTPSFVCWFIYNIIYIYILQTLA